MSKDCPCFRLYGPTKYADADKRITEEELQKAYERLAERQTKPDPILAEALFTDPWDLYE